MQSSAIWAEFAHQKLWEILSFFPETRILRTLMEGPTLYVTTRFFPHPHPILRGWVCEAIELGPEPFLTRCPGAGQEFVRNAACGEPGALLPSHSSDSSLRKFGLDSVEWSGIDSDSDKLTHGHGFISFQYFCIVLKVDKGFLGKGHIMPQSNNQICLLDANSFSFCGDVGRAGQHLVTHSGVCM